MGICITQVNLIIIICVVVALFIYIFNRTTVQPIFIKNERRHDFRDRNSDIVKTETHFNSTFPLGKYIGRDFDKGTVGYILDSDSGSQYPLFIQRYYNKYYYYTNINNIPLEVDNNPFYFDKMDGDTVNVNGKTYTTKIYRTNF